MTITTLIHKIEKLRTDMRSHENEIIRQAARLLSGVLGLLKLKADEIKNTKDNKTRAKAKRK